jgi:hypothetical protein
MASNFPPQASTDALNQACTAPQRSLESVSGNLSAAISARPPVNSTWLLRASERCGERDTTVTAAGLRQRIAKGRQ